MKQLKKEQAQDHYDGLINLSNLSFKNSMNLNQNGMLKISWAAKAETYHAAAAMFYNLCSLAGSFLKHSKTDYENFIEQERYDSCREDAETDVAEAFYREEIL